MTAGTAIEPLLLTADELGRLLGVARCTIWTWHSSGKIPLPLKIGGTTRWRREEIEEWLKAGAPGRAKWGAIAQTGLRPAGTRAKLEAGGYRKDGRAISRDRVD